MNNKKADIINAIKRVVKLQENNFVAWKIARKYRDPFKVLVATLLSQNTTDKAAIVAFDNLEKNIGVNPWKLEKVDLEKISENIQVAGLHNIKAKAIKELSRIVIEKYGGDLDIILKKDLEAAREELTSLPRIGKKTADVILLMLANKPVLPIDTHIRRVALRLGISKRKDYYSIQTKLINILKNKDLIKAHLYLIEFGRKICRAKNPLCQDCPLNIICKYYRLKKKAK